jgi:hypothetical protein
VKSSTSLRDLTTTTGGKGLGAALAIALVAATAGCSGAGDPTAHDGDLLVGIRYRGGPAPGRPRTLEPGRVRLLKSDGRPLTSANAKRGHNVRFSVAAGRYRLTASSGSARCIPRSATARAGQETRVSITCSVK